MAEAVEQTSDANETPVPSPGCEHMRLEVMGVSRAATYLRCRCGALLVQQDGSMWPLGVAFG